MLKQIGVPVDVNFTWLHPDPHALRSLHEKWQPGTNRWIVCNPGARWENKRWPIESYAAAVRSLADANPQVRIVVLGSGNDAALGAAFVGLYPAAAWI